MKPIEDANTELLETFYVSDAAASASARTSAVAVNAKVNADTARIESSIAAGNAMVTTKGGALHSAERDGNKRASL